MSLALARLPAGISEKELLRLVLRGVSSSHSRRAYEKGLRQFFCWMGTQGEPLVFSKALLTLYRAHLTGLNLAPATINLRLSPVRKLAHEMADHGLLDLAVATAIAGVPGVEQRGTRTGKWILRDQANVLLNAPDATTLRGKRDRAILALLLRCGLRRAELRLRVEDLQQREGRWVIPDIQGKGKRLRTVPIPASVKVRIDDWLCAAGIQEGFIFRPVNRGDRVSGESIGDEQAIWRIVLNYARQTELDKLAPHDLLRTCAKLCRKADEDLEQIQLLLGHASIQTTERYPSHKQELAIAGNDGIELEME